MGQNLPTPRIYALVSHPSCRRSVVGRTAYEPWSMRIVDDGSPAPTFWSFVLGHDNVSPVEQQRHWLEDIVCLELIRHKDVSIVSISKISKVMMSNCSSLMLWNLQLYNNSFEWKNVTFSGGQNILWPLLHIFRGSWPTPTPGSTLLGLLQLENYQAAGAVGMLAVAASCYIVRFTSISGGFVELLTAGCLPDVYYLLPEWSKSKA